MGAKLKRLAVEAVWWILEVLASMTIGALALGAGGLVLGLVSGRVEVPVAVQVGAMVGAGLGAIVAFGPGFASYGPRERTGSGSSYRPGDRDCRPR